MALTKGTGPFGERSSGTFNFDTSVLKAHTLYFENCPKRVRAVFNGETVVDSRWVKILHETGHLPVYYFPPEDVRTELLAGSETKTVCPYKGVASHWSAEVDGERVEDAAWEYPESLPEATKVEGHFCFYDDKAELEVDGEKQG